MRFVAGLLIPSACAALTAAPLAAQLPYPPERLAQWFFQSPRLSRPQISPSGTHIAALYSQDGNEMLVVRAIGGGDAVPLVSLPDPEARFRWLRWANDDRILFSVEELAPSRQPPKGLRTRLYGIDRDGSRHLHMAKNWGKSILVGRGDFQYEDQILDMLEDDPRHVLISIRKPTEAYPAVYRMDVRNGGLRRLVELVEGVSYWHTDHQGTVRAGTGYRYGKWRLFARPSATEDFVELAEYDYLEGDGIFFEGFSFDPKTLYVSTRKGDTTALYEYDLTTRSLGRELFSMPGFDVPSWLEFSEERKVLTAAGYVSDRRGRHFFDEAAERRQGALNRALPGTFNEIVSESLDRKTVLVRARGDRKPPAYYLYRPDDKELSFLFSEAPAVAGLDLVPMEAVSYEARDGLRIPAYLTRPKGGGESGLPLVVVPHGGPSARDEWDWDASVQYLAALGFAVLQPNFRGSTGYGGAHWSAGLQEWGLAMQDDVTDGVRWLIDAGTVDPDRICIYGGSYGGYTALMGLVKTPELFRCAASYAGPTDLVMMLNHDRGYLFSEVNVPTVGSSTKDRARLRDNSPLQNVDKLRSPILLGHGEDDERVHVAHATKLAGALEKAGRPVELVVLENERHAFRAEEGRIHFYRQLGRFLLEHTAPRSERPETPG